MLSGDPVALEEVVAELGARGVFARKVKVDVASHCPQMDALRSDILEALGSIVSTAPRIPIVSTVTARRVCEGQLDASYWVRNLRDPVLFSPVIQTLLHEGRDTFLEVSPHPIVLPAIVQGASHAERSVVVVAAGRRGEPESATISEAVGALYVAGHSIDWERVGPKGQLVTLPSYPWQRERYWLEPPTPQASGQLAAASVAACGHPLLGLHVSSSVQEGRHYWQNWLDSTRLCALADHVVDGAIVFPAAGYIEMAFAAAQEVLGDGVTELEAVELRTSLVLPPSSACTTQTVLTEFDRQRGKRNNVRDSQPTDGAQKRGRRGVGPSCQG